MSFEINTNPLYNARKAQSIDLNEVASSLKVNKLHLQALEDGDIRAIEGKVYMSGLVRSYARYLGVDEDKALIHFRSINVNNPNTKLSVTDCVKNNFIEYNFMHSDIKIYVIALLMIVLTYCGWFFMRPNTDIQILYHPVVKLSLLQAKKSFSGVKDLALVAKQDSNISFSGDSDLHFNYHMLKNEVFFISYDELLHIKTNNPNQIDVFNKNENGDFIGTVEQLL